jgi:hypothetical protein
MRTTNIATVAHAAFAYHVQLQRCRYFGGGAAAESRPQDKSKVMYLAYTSGPRAVNQSARLAEEHAKTFASTHPHQSIARLGCLGLGQ